MAESGVPVVGIGASAGGVKALQQFFGALPEKTGAAYVVIVHLDPDTRSDMAAILGNRSKMKVTQVQQTEKLQPNSVYVIPPGRQLKITDSEISAVPFDEPRGLRAPIDLFFRSLASQHGDGFAVILTGAGSDGAAGVRAIKEAGGIILVQSPEEAEYPSMPLSAIATEAADFVLPIKQLAERLAEQIHAREGVSRAKSKNDQDEHLRRILAHLRVRTGHDFSLYKRSTVMRRVMRRMQVNRNDELGDYAHYLRENPEEAQALLTDLLISVTTFFRDTKAFEVLARDAIPNLFTKNNHAIRVWVAGCATGEEAYSIGILLLEEASKHDVRPEIQVFASDMDTRALAIAREGRYPVAVESDLTEDRLRRFFTREGEYYRVKRELRDIVLFSSHSVLKDPPFSRLDLVSCRNLLIYLERDLQSQVIATLHYGLNLDGYLFLGTSESGEHVDGLFRAIDRDARIYQSTGKTVDRLPTLPRLSGILSGIEQYPQAAGPQAISARAAQQLHREALEEMSPPSILVDEELRVIHLSENAGRYLLPSAGPLTTDVTDLVRPELRFELRSALHRAFEHDHVALISGVLVKFNGSSARVYAQVRPVIRREHEKTAKGAVVLFVEGESGQAIEALTADVQDSAVAAQLKEELELTQMQLRTTREESEAANEELRAANEELQSINEEYRSTAEELETSKEELQSINEGLQTVNSELKLKLETVSRANSDLQNLMAATDFATLFLDPFLRIKRFTPKLAELFNITPTDTGRPITDFTHQLDCEGLAADARRVLDDLVPVEREINSRRGGIYQVRFRPYRTMDDKIDGVVATFLDVTERRRLENALKSRGGDQANLGVVEGSRSAALVWQNDGTILQWNRGSEALFGFLAREALDKKRDTLLKTRADGATPKKIADALKKDGYWRGKVTHTSKNGKAMTVNTLLEVFKVGRERLVLETATPGEKTKSKK